MSKTLSSAAKILVSSFSDDIIKAVFKVLVIKIPDVKEVLSDSYDQLLTNVVTNRNSKTRPELYKDEFMDRLDSFKFVEVTDGDVKFITPDNRNFDFAGRLRVIETILEGVVGVYVEVSEDQYKQIYGKQKIPKNPLDSSASSKEKIYLEKYNNFIRTKEKELKIHLVKYPFSNHPPIDLFTGVDKYVTKHLQSWIDEGVTLAKTVFIKSYSRGFK